MYVVLEFVIQRRESKCRTLQLNAETDLLLIYTVLSSLLG